MSRISSFKYVEYSGDDAADVLVTLIMNLTHPELATQHGEQEGSLVETPSDTELDRRIIGFVPNREKEQDKEEDDDEHTES